MAVFSRVEVGEGVHVLVVVYGDRSDRVSAFPKKCLECEFRFEIGTRIEARMAKIANPTPAFLEQHGGHGFATNNIGLELIQPSLVEPGVRVAMIAEVVPRNQPGLEQIRTLRLLAGNGW
jgi:hypothetical protein